MPEHTESDNVYALWLDAITFLTSAAPANWSVQMRAGVKFLMPPPVRALPTVPEQAAALAAAERERLQQARLHHLDADAVRAAENTELHIHDLAELAPSPYGFLVWQEPPAYVGTSGVPVAAVSWGIADDGGTWVSWWTDTRAAADLLGRDVRQMLAGNGPLTYHQETHIPPHSSPHQIFEPSHPDHAIYAAVLRAWTAIESGALRELGELPPAKALRKHARHAGVGPRPVHRYTAGHKAPAADPQTIVRRVLAGHLVPDKPYPGTLPADLAPWHCYTADSGHSLLIWPDLPGDATTATLTEDAAVSGALIPAPVKAVLAAGWELRDGYVHSPLPYDPQLGLLTDPEHDEH